MTTGPGDAERERWRGWARLRGWLPRPRLPRRRWARWTLGVVAALVAVVLVLAGTVTGLLVAEDSGPISPAARSTGNDALWLGHAWVDGRKSQADVDKLAAQLRTTGIRDLFVHSGPLNDNGTLSAAKYPKARWLVAALHQALPGVRVQAWLGDVVGGGHLDLASAATRANVATSARQILAAAGFDGVHLDLEPVASGDPGYLALLSQVRRVTPLLSVSADQVAPLGWLTIAHWWSAGYLHQVATRVHEVAIMTYDSGMPAGAMFAGYVHRETELALAAVPPATTLLMGAPAYRSGNFGHFSSAETVSAAVRGVRLAISPAPPANRKLGIALYVDFTATAQDWADYRDGWVRPPPH